MVSRLGSVDGAAAVRARTEVMDTYRRFPTLDPRLPLELLPAGWPRRAARDLFAAVYDGLAEAAETTSGRSSRVRRAGAAGHPGAHHRRHARRHSRGAAMRVTISLDELLGDEVRRDPYPFYARLPRRGRRSLRPADPHALVVHGYDAVNRVLRDPVFRVLGAEYLDRAGVRWREPQVIRILQSSMLNAAEGDHLRVRHLFSRAPPRRVAALEPAIGRIADDLLDRLAAEGADGRPVDFMARFALRLPSDVIGELLGVPEADREWFPSRVRAFDAVLEIGRRSMREVRAANVAAAELTAYFTGLVAARRAAPRDDFVSALLRGLDDEPGRLTSDELLANLIIMYNAGFRTTANLLGNGLVLLTERPDARPRCAPSRRWPRRTSRRSCGTSRRCTSRSATPPWTPRSPVCRWRPAGPWWC
ncbi:cytochrome P450 [Micromonospora sp. BRA006-A]|nr:cytochrome P450 [Micromonospora sp. BRA006-A]